MKRILSVVGLVFVIACATPSVSSAQSAAPSPGPFANLVFGATLEGYYQVNSNNPPDRVVPLRAYDTRSDMFSIQQTSLVIESAPSVADGRRFGLRVDLQFGQATETVQGNPLNEPRPNVYRHLWQAYGTYVIPVGRGLQADFGKFGSNLGYETNYAKDNHHFSRALLFNFLPYYHMGMRLTLPVSDKVTVLYALTNGIQQTEDTNTFKSHHVTTIVSPVAGVVWTTSAYRGREQSDGNVANGPDGVFTVVDSYLTYQATPALTLAVDVNYATGEVRKADPSLSLQGTAFYARYQTRSPVALALRYERLDDEGLFAGAKQVLQEVTATIEHKLADGFVVRGEFRRDWSNTSFSQRTGLVGLVWWFGNKLGGW